MAKTIKILTTKENEVVGLVLTGLSKTKAVKQVYNCKNDNSAGVLANTIFNKEKIKTEVRKRQQIIRQGSANKVIKLIDLIEGIMPPSEIAMKLVENIMSEDKRVSDSALDKYLKIRGAYATGKESKYDGAYAERERIIDVFSHEEEKVIEKMRADKENIEEADIVEPEEEPKEEPEVESRPKEEEINEGLMTQQGIRLRAR